MTLDPEEYVQFLKTQLDLLYFVGKKTRLLSKNLSKNDFLDKGMTVKFDCRQALYKDDNLIDQYIKEKGFELSHEERAILEGIKNRVSGDFIIFKTLTHYAIFNSMEDNNFYAVKALGDPFTKFFSRFPVMVKATLLPFKGKIIYDGFIQSAGVYVGPNMRSNINEEYKKAKKNKKLIMSLK